MELALNVAYSDDSHRGDVSLIELWLRDRSPHTQSAYRRDVARFLAHVGKELAEVTLADLQAYADTITHLAQASRARMLSAVKSLLAFGHRAGLLPVDAGRPLKLPPVDSALAARVLSEAEVHQIIATEPTQRNRVLVRLLYGAGLRVSEVCRLTWCDLRARGGGGELTVDSGSAKTRVVSLTPATWHELLSLRNGLHLAPDDDGPLFRSQKGGHLHASSVWRIVRAAADRAGVDLPVSPHWLRHAHAAHALDRGAPLRMVQATLGHQSIASTGRYLRERLLDSSAHYLEV
ncbi:MAG TPA: tyrosine-type recombinase/integrase [Chloroflexota bacterium]|nr:tyrosine-type recombinase/integrase [Chloroflexota bacterium]